MKKQLIYLIGILILTGSCSQNSETVINTPSISSYSPKEGFIGDTITIIGANFNSKAKITLLDIDSKIIQIDDSKIKIIVPEGVQKGNNPIKLRYSNETIAIGNFDAIIDDYNYLIYDNHTSEIYEVGNNTGNLEFINKIDIDTPNQISTYGFTKKDNIIYLINFTPEHKNTLISYNIKTQETLKIDLMLPNQIKGSITVLNWNINNDKLIGIVVENTFTTDITKHHLIEINPSSGFVTSKNLFFNHSFISSHIIKDDNLFLFSSTSPYDISKINLTNYSFENISTNNELFSLTKPSLNTSNEIICLKDYGNTMGKLVLFDENKIEITPLLPNKEYLFSNRLGYGFSDKNTNEFIGIYFDFSIENTTGNQPVYNSLYKFDTSSSIHEEKIFFRPLKTSFSSPTIIDIIEK